MDENFEQSGGAPERIRSAGRRFRPLFLTLAFVLPAVVCAYWILYPLLPATLRGLGRAGYFIASEPELPVRLTALGISLVPALFGALAAWTMARLMGLYQAGRIFTADTVRCFVLVGRYLVLGTGASILVRPLLSVALTWNNPPGQKALAITFGSTDLSGLIAGGIVLLIAWVMEEGRKLDEDRRLTV